MTDIEQYRSGFEAWFLVEMSLADDGKTRDWIFKRYAGGGKYLNSDVELRWEGYAAAKCEASTEQQGGAAPADDYLLLGYATNSSVATLRERISAGADGLTTSIRARPYNKCTVAIYALVSQQVSAAIGTPAKSEASTEPSAVIQRLFNEFSAEEGDGTEDGRNFLAGKAAGVLAVKHALGLAGSGGAQKDEAKDAVIAAARKLVQCKGRYHSELNFKELAAAIAAHTKAQEGKV